MSDNIHFTLLPEHILPYEIFWIVHKSHVQQELASSEFPEGPGKKKNKFEHSFFFYWYCDIDEEGQSQSTTLLLKL